MPTVVFDPSGDKVSSLTIPTSNFSFVLPAGFAYEVLVKVDVNPSAYVGVIDFEESGGFGLNVYPSTKSGYTLLHAELATGTSGWLVLKHEIKLGEWNHVVFSYDGTNLALYVNGELVASETATDAMRLPKFTNGMAEYICIGGCAQSTSESGIRGFTGAIAVCNLFLDPLSGEQAAAMFEKYTLPEYDNSEETTEREETTEKNEETTEAFDPLARDVFEMDVTANGPVNALNNGVAVNKYGTGANNVSFDSDLNKNVLVFDGTSEGENYLISAGLFESTLSDGFAYEVYFKATSNGLSNKNYMSVIDYCEAGGFGLNLYKTSDSSVLTIKGEIKIGSGYVSPEYNVNVGEWVHCVFSYDGNNIQLYVNGVLVDEVEASGSLGLPNFGGSEKVICIGSGASKGAISGDRFIGSIAVCNIFSTPVTAEEVGAMFEQHTLPGNDNEEETGKKEETTEKNEDTTEESGTVSTDIFEMNVTADGPVNAVNNGVAVNKYGTGANNVSFDSDVNKNVLVFDGTSEGENYLISAGSFESTLSDGFAYEVYFKATSNGLSNKSYMSVLDYCEAGGFGLNLYKTGDSSVLTIKGEIKIGSGYVNPEYNINVGEWVHCVFSYNGNSIQLYVNGVLVDEVAANGSFGLPSFGTSEKVICIGSGAGKGYISGDRFIGSIAVCNIYSAPVTAEEAAIMYSTHTAK